MVSIKRGNEGAAEILRHLIDTQHVFYEGQVWSKSNSEADKRLLTNSGMNRAPQLNMGFQRDLADRVAIYEKNNMYTRLSHKDLMIAATALDMDAELLSMDVRFCNAFTSSGGKVAPESYSLGKDKNPIPSHMEGRRLMRLPALNISKEGKILPKPGPPPGPPPRSSPQVDRATPPSPAAAREGARRLPPKEAARAPPRLTRVWRTGPRFTKADPRLAEKPSPAACNWASRESTSSSRPSTTAFRHDA